MTPRSDTTDPRTTDPRTEPRGADVEIVERTPDSDVHVIGLIKPNTVRINGTAVAVPADAEIVIEPLPIHRAHECVRVTLTLYARSVTIRAEEGEAK